MGKIYLCGIVLKTTTDHEAPGFVARSTWLSGMCATVVRRTCEAPGLVYCYLYLFKVVTGIWMIQIVYFPWTFFLHQICPHYEMITQVISPYFGVFTSLKVKNGLRFWSHPSKPCHNHSILTGGSLKGGAGVQWHSRVSWGCEYPWEWAVESVPVLVCLREFVLMQLVCNSL